MAHDMHIVCFSAHQTQQYCFYLSNILQSPILFCKINDFAQSTNDLWTDWIKNGHVHGACTQHHVILRSVAKVV